MYLYSLPTGQEPRSIDIAVESANGGVKRGRCRSGFSPTCRTKLRHTGAAFRYIKVDFFEPSRSGRCPAQMPAPGAGSGGSQACPIVPVHSHRNDWLQRSWFVIGNRRMGPATVARPGPVRPERFGVRNRRDRLAGPLGSGLGVVLLVTRDFLE